MGEVLRVREAERRILDALDVDGMVQFLRELISVPSIGGEETAAQKLVANRLRSLGFDTDVWSIDIDSTRMHPSFSMGIERKEGLGVVGSTGESSGRSLILNGHIDVVSPGDEANWRHPPWSGTVADGAVHGRGSVDMKGGLSCAVYAIKAIMDAGVKLDGRVSIESVIGEEDGGIGTLATVMRGYKADAAIIMEPTELRVIASQAGALAFRVNIHGKSAHACMRQEGVSAIEKFIILHEALKKLEAERNRDVKDPLYGRFQLPYPLSIGKIEGGSWPGTVAESLSFEGRIGVPFGETVQEARAELELAVRRASQSDPWLSSHPPKVEWIGYQFRPSRISPDHPIVLALARSYEDVSGETAEIEGVTYSSDMHYLVADANTPTCLFGPGDVRVAHSPNECVPVGDLVAAARTLSLTAVRFCGYDLY